MTCAKSFAGAAHETLFSDLDVRADTLMILTWFVETVGGVVDGEWGGFAGGGGQWDFGIREAQTRRADMDGPGRAEPGKTLSFHFVSARHGPLPRSDSALDTILCTLELARSVLAVTRASRAPFPVCLRRLRTYMRASLRTCVCHELRIARGLSQWPFAKGRVVMKYRDR